jgi:hypothetical protein
MYLTVYESPFTCDSRVRDREAAGTRNFDVTVEWRAGWKWTVDAKSPIHPARFNVYTKNDSIAGAEPSLSSWFPTEGYVEVLCASRKRGRVRLRLLTVKAIVDTTVDAFVCE